MTRPLPLRGFAAAGLLAVGALIAACHPMYVVVPQPQDGYSSQDTLHGRLNGRDVLVTFRFDTTWRVDTVTRWRTIYREGARVDTVVIVETDRDRRPPPGREGDHRPQQGGNGGRRPPSRGGDTVFVVIHDTVRVGDPRRPGQRVDTVRVVIHDTVRVGDTRRPGGPIVMPPPPNLGRVDTVRIIIHDTIRVTHRDTVRVVIHDTVRVGSGGGGSGGGDGGGGTGGRTDNGHRPRSIFVPPGQAPPPGQCRVWIVGTPPGQQARPAPCDALGAIPSGAFILFGGKGWDADYDWTTDPDAAHVPPEILAIARQRHH